MTSQSEEVMITIILLEGFTFNKEETFRFSKQKKKIPASQNLRSLSFWRSLVKEIIRWIMAQNILLFFVYSV